MKRALALAVLVRETELDPVLTGPRPAAEDLGHRKKVERALLRLSGELLEPLGGCLCSTQAGRKGEGRNEYPDFSLRHSQPPFFRRSRPVDGAQPRDLRVQRPF
jgi:hypothetical protein